MGRLNSKLGRLASTIDLGHSGAVSFFLMFWAVEVDNGRTS